MFDRFIRNFVISAASLVLLGAAGLIWTVQRRLFSESELAGTPCPEVPHDQVLRLGLVFSSATSEDRNPVNGILVNTIQTRKRCAQMLGHASCGLQGPGYTRVRAGGTLAHFVLADGQAAFLDIRAGNVRCVLAPRAVVHERF